MSDTTATVLTPRGAGGIASIQIRGSRAWELAQKIFTPVQGSLPQIPPLHRFWFGTLGVGIGDQVVLAVKELEPVCTLEVHCHGGKQVVSWVLAQFTSLGAIESRHDTNPSSAWRLLEQARTLRTASILLDQAQGVFHSAVEEILASIDADMLQATQTKLEELARFATLGCHLVEPWKVMIAGAPNVGKSSLINALAGFERSIVSEVAGTTRDLVKVVVAFEGWPVELADSAGLRDVSEILEATGIEQARRFLDDADLVIWVVDGTSSEPNWPESSRDYLLVVNKCDQPCVRDLKGALRVSALTRVGLDSLIQAIVRRLVPTTPLPGVAVPFSPQLAASILQARDLASAGHIMAARRILATLLID